MLQEGDWGDKRHVAQAPVTRHINGTGWHKNSSCMM